MPEFRRAAPYPATPRQPLLEESPRPLYRGATPGPNTPGQPLPKGSLTPGFPKAGYPRDRPLQAAVGHPTGRGCPPSHDPSHFRVSRSSGPFLPDIARSRPLPQDRPHPPQPAAAYASIHSRTTSTTFQRHFDADTWALRSIDRVSRPNPRALTTTQQPSIRQQAKRPFLRKPRNRRAFGRLTPHGSPQRSNAKGRTRLLQPSHLRHFSA